MTRTFLILLAMLLLSREALANVLQNIRIHEGPDHVRVVFDTTEAVIYELSTLNAPERVVVDFVNLKPVAGLDTELVGASRERINSLRTAEEGGRYRVVLEMKSRHTPKDFTLKPIPPYGHRLVIDLFAGEGARSQVPVQPMPSGSGT